MQTKRAFSLVFSHGCIISCSTRGCGCPHPGDTSPFLPCQALTQLPVQLGSYTLLSNARLRLILVLGVAMMQALRRGAQSSLRSSRSSLRQHWRHESSSSHGSSQAHHQAPTGSFDANQRLGVRLCCALQVHVVHGANQEAMCRLAFTSA